MAAKIRIKLGAIEVECEGSEEFLRRDLLVLVSEVLKSGKELGAEPHQALSDSTIPAVGANNSIGTTQSIAARLKASTARDLVLAAAYRLTLGLGQGSFTREQLLSEMKSATSYYHKNYSANLSKAIAALLRNSDLNETSANTYAMTAAKLAEMESTLAT